jgi:hypothetical protein
MLFMSFLCFFFCLSVLSTIYPALSSSFCLSDLHRIWFSLYGSFNFLLGCSGLGKSTFINTLCAKEVTQSRTGPSAADALSERTVSIEPYLVGMAYCSFLSFLLYMYTFRFAALLLAILLLFLPIPVFYLDIMVCRFITYYPSFVSIFPCILSLLNVYSGLSIYYLLFFFSF